MKHLIPCHYYLELALDCIGLHVFEILIFSSLIFKLKFGFNICLNFMQSVDFIILIFELQFLEDSAILFLFRFMFLIC